MKTNLSQFMPDKTLAEEGVWKEIFPGIKFKIAYAGRSNTKFRELSMANAVKSKQTIDPSQISEKDIKEFSKNDLPVFAGSIIKDWKGVYNDNNRVLPFSEENALLLLEQYPELYTKMAVIALDASQFKLPSEKEKFTIKKK